MQQKDVSCDGEIDINCGTGCISISKVLYSCEMTVPSNPTQLKLVQDLCENKNRCSVKATRETFGYEECPEESKSGMYLWLTYSCNGKGFQDKTKIIGPKRCKDTTTKPTGKI